MYVYLIREDTGNYKIGVSKLPVKRLSELQTANSNKLILEKAVKVNNGFIVESLLHKCYGGKRLNGEWFSLDEKDLEVFETKALLYDRNYDLVKDQNTYLNK